MIIKNILRGLSLSAPRPDVMYDGGIIMKKRRKQGLWLRRNLPLLIAAAALVLLILIIVLVAKGCSKTSDTTIQAEAFSTKTTIGLPVSAELNSADFVSYGGYQFTTKKSLSAMSKLVTKNNDGVTAESFTNSYGTCAVFTKANESGGTDTWCLYAKDPQNTKNWYIFMGEHRELALESGTLDLLLPLHLITDAELLDTMFAALQPGTPYTCGLDKLPDGQTLSSLFRTFYETSGLYTVTGSDSGFTLVPRGGAQELTFQFDEQDGSGRFMISVPQNTEPQPTASAVVTYGKDDPVTLPEDASVALSTVLLQANYKKTGKTADYKYTVDLSGQVYEVALDWKDNTWNGSVRYNGQVAMLVTKSSCTVASIFASNGLGGTPQRDTAKWPNDVQELVITPMAESMATTNDVNVRTAPSTNSEVLMTMPTDTVVAVIGVSEDTEDGAWYEIWYNEVCAYLNAKYVKSISSAAPATSEPTTTAEPTE